MEDAYCHVNSTIWATASKHEASSGEDIVRCPSLNVLGPWLTMGPRCAVESVLDPADMKRKNRVRRQGHHRCGRRQIRAVGKEWQEK